MLRSLYAAYGILWHMTIEFKFESHGRLSATASPSIGTPPPLLSGTLPDLWSLLPRAFGNFRVHS